MYRIPGVLLILWLTLGSSPARADWLVKRLVPQQGTLAGCVVESTPLLTQDGYQETQVSIVVSSEHVLIKARAPLDDSFEDLGLQVETFDFIKPDSVFDRRSALFASSYRTILEQLKKSSAPAKKGQKSEVSTVRVRLRFWPTWPATGSYVTEFSLDGFSKAYTEMLACK